MSRRLVVFSFKTVLAAAMVITLACTPAGDGAPADGSARTDGNCNERVLRGGSWVTAPETTRSAFRDGIQGRGQQDRFIDQGFRVVRVDL